MKNWILLRLAGPLGVVIRPVLAAMIGVVVAAIYDQAWIIIYKVAWLKWLAEGTIARLDPAVVQAMTPAAVGTATALILWGFGMDWVMGNIREGTKQVQGDANKSPVPATIRKDGIILPGGETAQLISRMAYETIYPGEKRPRHGPDIRRPLP